MRLSGSKTTYKIDIIKPESEKTGSDCGVPQGSVLGPLLFTIYVNDLYLVWRKSFVNLFADDTLLCMAGKQVQEMVSDLNGELDIMYDWLCKNKLKLNTEKTKCMILGSKSNCKKYDSLGL